MGLNGVYWGYGAASGMVVITAAPEFGVDGREGNLDFNAPPPTYRGGNANKADVLSFSRSLERRVTGDCDASGEAQDREVAVRMKVRCVGNE